jgi:hypothetical protein
MEKNVAAYRKYIDWGTPVRVMATSVPVSREKPHGLECLLTLHVPDGVRPVGFDNAHRVVQQNAVSRRIIGTGCGRSGLTNTGARRRCSVISGRQRVRRCAGTE